MIKVKLLRIGSLPPCRANASDAGLDLFAEEDVTILPGSRQLVCTGIAISIPEGHVAYVKPRSGLAVKCGIDVMAGVIDSQYRGEVMALLVNLGREPFHVFHGDRIAQLVIQKIELWNPVVVDELDETERGENGFGSTERLGK